MAKFDSSVNLWSLSPHELAAACQAMAEDTQAVGPTLRAEASLLLSGWQEALELPSHHFDERSHRETLFASLRKRTIEIAVKTHPPD